jgi:hypothetical protein
MLPEATAFCFNTLFSPVFCGFDGNFAAHFSSFENVGFVCVGSFLLQL